MALVVCQESPEQTTVRIRVRVLSKLHQSPPQSLPMPTCGRNTSVKKAILTTTIPAPGSRHGSTLVGTYNYVNNIKMTRVTGTGSTRPHTRARGSSKYGNLREGLPLYICNFIQISNRSFVPVLYRLRKISGKIKEKKTSNTQCVHTANFLTWMMICI